MAERSPIRASVPAPAAARSARSARAIPSNVAHAGSTNGAAAQHASAIGNQEMLRRMDAAGIRPKLDVSNPGDAHEVEADRVAEQVMSMPLDRAAEDEEESVATRRLDRAEAAPTDEEESVATRRLDRAEAAPTDEEESVATRRLDRAEAAPTDEEESVATR